MTPTRVALALAFLAADAIAAVAPVASYEVSLTATAPPRIAVRATLPSDGNRLDMAISRPGNIPELADAGWPALVRNLVVADASGSTVGASGAGARGWTLERVVHGPVTLAYEVDFAPLAARQWPAPREAAYADDDHFVAIARALFVTTPAQGASDVRFVLPERWRAVTPWPAGRRLRVPAAADLTENLVAFTRAPAAMVTAGGLRVSVVPLGHWRAAGAEVREATERLVKQLAAFVRSDGGGDAFLVVLLPHAEDGGESFRASFAMTREEPPSRANLDGWGNMLAHETFHRWNGWRLQGADYASSQWFQEGFTEYAANLALVSSGLTGPDSFHARLERHVANYGRLATPLDAPGTHKGPPLYSGGALVAFAWDGMIREATRNRRGIGDVLRELLRATGGGARPYAWPDIRAALERVAPGAWDDFHARHVHGREPLPLEAAFARVGLRLSRDAAGAPRVEPDPDAAASAVQRGRALMGAVAGR